MSFISTKTSTGRGSITARLSVACMLALAGGLPVVAVAPAAAQVSPVASYVAVVAADDVLLRCGESDLMYPVARLARGQIVRCDGEGRGWSRIAYPAGTPVFAFADYVTLDNGGKTATVTKTTRLKAVNLTTGLKGSWKDALEQSLPVGTKLTLIDAEPVPDGRGNTAFRVAAPESARAYVPSGSLQRATQEQINAFMATQAAKQPEVAPVRPVAAAPGTGLTEPMAVPGSGGGVSRPSEAGLTPGGDPGSPTVINQKPVVQAPVPVPPSPYERLEAAFEEIRKQPADQAEFSELMAEYQAEIAKLDDSPSSKVIRPRLQLRLDFLKLQSDLQTQIRAFGEMQQNSTEAEKKLAERLADVDRVRQYTIVGRLSASTIYDGKRMPLMYRVQAVGGPAPRTLGYLKPDEKLKIDSKIGQVVGVVGQGVVDPVLKLNIIQPLRIDTLEPAAPAPTPVAAPTSPASEAPKPPAPVPGG